MFEALLIGLIPLMAIFAAENQYRTRRRFKEAGEQLGLRYIGADRPALQGQLEGVEIGLTEQSDHHGEAQLCARCPLDLGVSITPREQHLFSPPTRRILTGAQDFDERFVVSGGELSALIALTPRARDLLLTQSARCSVRLQDGELLLFRAATGHHRQLLVQLAKDAVALARALTWSWSPQGRYHKSSTQLVLQRAKTETMPDTVRRLYRALFRNPSDETRAEAERLLTEGALLEVGLMAAEHLGDLQRARAEARALLTVDSPSRRARGALALARLGAPEAERPLLRLLGRSTALDLEAVIDALGDIASVAAVEPLLPLTRGLRHSRSVKLKARMAIAKIQRRAGQSAPGGLSVVPQEPQGELSLSAQGALSTPELPEG